MELQEIRNEIDRLDKQIQSLFEERMLLCQDVARYKKAHNMPVFQAGREQQILDRVEQNAKEGLGLASRTMFANMMSSSSQFSLLRVLTSRSGRISSGTREPRTDSSPRTYLTPSTSSISSIMFRTSLAGRSALTSTMCVEAMSNSSESLEFAMTYSMSSGRH